MVKAPPKRKKKSSLASKVVVSMFLRLPQSLHLQMQDNQHESATGSHSPETESVYIPSSVLSFCRCTNELVSKSRRQKSSTTCPKLAESTFYEHEFLSTFPRTDITVAWH